MNIGLFAAGKVGYEVVKFFVERKERLACLVLDPADLDGVNTSMCRDSEMHADMIFFSDCLYEASTLESLKRLDLDLVILAWWPYIIKKPLIDMPRIGCLNFHPSLLPHNRGKHYYFWSIMEEGPFGVSIHFVNEKVDEGDIAFQATVEKTWEDTGESLYRKSQEAILNLFKQNFNDIKAGRIPRVPQDLRAGSFHHSGELAAASRIDLDGVYTARHLLNIIRGRTFWSGPSSWFEDAGQRYEVRIEIRNAGDGHGNKR